MHEASIPGPAPERTPQEREALRLIAPCGLYCGGCLAFVGGPIRTHAKALRELLGPNFDAYAERLSEFQPALRQYPEFKGLLAALAKGTCRGCRESGCMYGNCQARACALARQVDYCGRCPDFPCESHGFPPELAARWRKNSEILRDRGVGALLELVRSRPRYP